MARPHTQAHTQATHRHHTTGTQQPHKTDPIQDHHTRPRPIQNSEGVGALALHPGADKNQKNMANSNILKIVATFTSLQKG